jgi:hypothetical protein
MTTTMAIVNYYNKIKTQNTKKIIIYYIICSKIILFLK